MSWLTSSSHQGNFRPTLFPMYILRVLMPQIVKIGSPAFRRWLLEITPYQRLQRLKDITDTLERTVMDILSQKRAALAEGDEAVLRQVGEGKDIMSVLCESRDMWSSRALTIISQWKQICLLLKKIKFQILSYWDTWRASMITSFESFYKILRIGLVP